MSSLHRIFRLLTLLVLALIVPNQTIHAAESKAAASIADLGYVKGRDALLFVGNFQGKPARIVRSISDGRGIWDIYTGTLNDRVRLRFIEKDGLREVLALDQGHRIVLTRFGEERTEYRFYSAKNEFLAGAVLFRDNGRWRQGIMRSEVFDGYSRLERVTDISTQISNQLNVQRTSSLDKLWRAVQLISTASASDGPFDFSGLLRGLDGDDTALLGAAGGEMVKGGLVGLTAFTVRLLSTSEALLAGGALTAAGPFLIAAGAGVAVGLAANNVYNWAQAKNLAGSPGMSGLFDRLTADSTYSKQAAPWPKSTAEAASAASGRGMSTGSRSQGGGDISSLLSMSDQLDRLDSNDFAAALEKGSTCTKARDFACAERELEKAKKTAVGDRNRKSLISAWEKLDSEKQRVAKEEEAKRQEVARAKAQESERQRQAQQSESGFQWGKFAAMGAGALIGGVGRLSADKQLQALTSIAQDSMPGAQGMSNTQALVNTPSSQKNSKSGTESAADMKAKTKICASEYNGPNVDPQLDTLCKMAAFTACLHRVTQQPVDDAGGRQACKNLTAMLETVPKEQRSSYKCGYCPFPY